MTSTTSKLSLGSLLNGKFLRTATYYLVFIAMGMWVAILGPTLPDLAINIGADLSKLSFLFTARSFGFLVGAYFAGFLFDKIKGHPIIALFLLFSAAAIFYVPFTTALALLVIVVLVLGVSESVIDVGANTLLVWTYKDKVGSYMNGLHLCFGIGGFLAPVLLAKVLEISGEFSWAYWLMLPFIIGIAVLVFVIPSPTIEKAVSKSSQNGINWALVGSIIVFYFLWVGAESGFAGWVYAYALKSGLADKETAAYLTSAFWGAFTIARFIAVFLSMRFKPVILLNFSLIGTIGSLFLIASFPNSFEMLLTGVIGVGIFMASVFPSMIAFSERRMVISGKITSWFFIGSGIGGMTLPWVMGQFIEHNPQVVLYILMGSVAGAFIVLTLISFGLRPKILD